MVNRNSTKKARSTRDDAIAMAAASAISATWNRLLTEGLDHYAQMARQGMTQSEIAASVRTHLGGLSTSPEALRARESSTVAYGQGRAVSLVEQSAKGSVEFAFRTNVLDKATCEVCWDLDGTVVVIGSPDFYELTPPAKCLGDDLCRCEWAALAPEVIPSDGGEN